MNEYSSCGEDESVYMCTTEFNNCRKVLRKIQFRERKSIPVVPYVSYETGKKLQAVLDDSKLDRDLMRRVFTLMYPKESRWSP